MADFRSSDFAERDDLSFTAALRIDQTFSFFPRYVDALSSCKIVFHSVRFCCSPVAGSSVFLSVTKPAPSLDMAPQIIEDDSPCFTSNSTQSLVPYVHSPISTAHLGLAFVSKTSRSNIPHPCYVSTYPTFLVGIVNRRLLLATLPHKHARSFSCLLVVRWLEVFETLGATAGRLTLKNNSL